MRTCIAATAVALLAGLAPAKAGTEPHIGEVMTVAFSFCPKGWAPLNGQLLPINQNEALFTLLGTRYGGNGQTSFALPRASPAYSPTTGMPLLQCIALLGSYPSEN